MLRPDIYLPLSHGDNTTQEPRPKLDDGQTLEEIFARFFTWAQSLCNPVDYAERNIAGRDRRIHAIGFRLYYLNRSKLYTVRLHHYPFAGEIEQDVHDHSFSSRSGVLSGALIETVYTLEAANQGYEALYCFDDSTGLQQVEKSDKRYRTQIDTVKTFHPGQTFDLIPGKIHSVAVIDNTTTLMVKTASQAYQRALVIKQNPGS